MEKVEEKPFTISIALANIRDRAKTREFECYLRENLPAGVVLREHHYQPGAIYASGDIHELLADVSALVTIAGLVWNLYKLFVEKHRKEKGEGFVHLVVVYNKRSVVRVHRIGDDITTEEQLQESLKITQCNDGSQKRDGGQHD